ncbi:RNA polymerase II subunit A C-terminal domain phosphatase SSU72-like [Aethina tumida]|uniref:RNA polymerase II subunit A C-terminal domain phosphatase SSU72-like n=1 Tax=Aethina tumida TaxID=116153 RepID=UPI00096AE056|nr:RNA polymerase II subunit A C-terminal domain phosphatase SSU72-like [Aethina tumida]
MSTGKNLRIAVICSSNMNRSMEAHSYLAKKEFNVKSYGTGDKVKLPGASADKPNVYDFGTPYNDIYQDLRKKNAGLYTENGILHILDRNRRIKKHPERFQETEEVFDLLITCEERVYDQVLEHMDTREAKDNSIVHIVNFDITDNLDEATVGAFLITDFCTMIEKTSDLDDEIEDVLSAFEEKTHKRILHSIAFN